MVAKSALVTAQELLDMPDDDRRYELVRGELRKRLLAGAQHGKLAAKVAAALFRELYTTVNESQTQVGKLTTSAYHTAP